ncbi:sulfite exporter TauE/SafE family protein [Ignavibacterium album]|uniref:sulfite exporter TauE/SafE family protein n=1 Tax=Ignavibacterium album TaxID=591197 RepID=UPI0026EE84CA|nr:sulfite exporter TauE/SafE family protein [Ignavibacterium album]
MSPEILSALAIGFFGSAHCIGMCGPIAIALPVPQSNSLYFIAGRALYNIGRIFTYSFLGALFGLLGSRIVIAGFQQFTTIILGVIILLVVITPFRYKAKITQHRLIQKISSPIKSGIGELFKQGTIPSMFLIGVLNGFLPCGLVYIAIAGAIASGDAVSGMVYMILFGAGTFPAMFAATILGKFINLNIRRKLTKAVPVFAVVLAILFILRGMALGIPYISPKISAQTVSQTEIECHPTEK